MIERALIAAPGLLIGAAVGSYVGTAALRAAEGEQASAGRSRCDGCRKSLGFWATIPVVSYLVRGGRCDACREPIDPVHPVSEIVGAVMGCGLILTMRSPASWLLAVLGFALLAAAIIDAKTQRLPNLLTLVVAAAATGLAWLGGGEGLLVGAVAAVATFVALETTRWGFIKFGRRPGLGFGDVKLCAALAIWLGAMTPWMIVLASGLGLLFVIAVRPRDGRIAFGPMIALSAFVLGVCREAGLWPNLA
jgi:leader peptidase (prepilin peptidase)/N-methyltransferase